MPVKQHNHITTMLDLYYMVLPLCLTTLQSTITCVYNINTEWTLKNVHIYLAKQIKVILLFKCDVNFKKDK